jgi:hypothetical protein
MKTSTKEIVVITRKLMICVLFNLYSGAISKRVEFHTLLLSKMDLVTNCKSSHRHMTWQNNKLLSSRPSEFQKDLFLFTNNKIKRISLSS